MMTAMLQLVKSTSVGVVLASEAETSVGIPPNMIGFVVLALIAIPVVVIIMAAILGAPRNSRIPALFLASVVAMIGGTIVGFAAFGAVLGLLFPQ